MADVAHFDILRQGPPPGTTGARTIGGCSLTSVAPTSLGWSFGTLIFMTPFSDTRGAALAWTRRLCPTRARPCFTEGAMAALLLVFSASVAAGHLRAAQAVELAPRQSPVLG